MKRLLLVLIVFSGSAYGQNNGINIAIPQTPQSFQSDRVRAGDVECSAAIGSSTNVEFGVVGILNQEDPIYNLASQDPYNALYQLELEKKRLEVMKLQQEIVNLRQLKFEGSGNPTASNLIVAPKEE